MSNDNRISLTVEQLDDYEFRVRFDDAGLADLATDEPVPLGHGKGPNPGRLLLAAIANCLLSSLLFALRKFHNEPGPLRANATALLDRNAGGRWRIIGAEVELQLADTLPALQNAERALAQFEDFCIVTQSVRAGIPVAVRVRDAEGALVHTAVTTD